MNDASTRDLPGDRIQQVTIAGVTGLAVGAFLLSYDALHQLALTSHVPETLAWLWPLIVDGFILVSSLAVHDAIHTGQRARYPWLLVLTFSALSVTFNLLHAPRDPVAQLVAAIPPLALVLSFELLMRQIHHRLQQSKATTSVRKTANPPKQLRDDGPRRHISTAAVAGTSAAATAPPPPTAPSAAKATRSPRAVTQARAEAVRDDCARTGQPLTTAVLADRLGISDGYARRLLRQLNDAHNRGDQLTVEVDAGLPLAALRAVRP